MQILPFLPERCLLGDCSKVPCNIFEGSVYSDLFGDGSDRSWDTWDKIMEGYKVNMPEYFHQITDCKSLAYFVERIVDERFFSFLYDLLRKGEEIWCGSLHLFPNFSGQVPCIKLYEIFSAVLRNYCSNKYENGSWVTLQLEDERDWKYQYHSWEEFGYSFLKETGEIEVIILWEDNEGDGGISRSVVFDGLVSGRIISQ